MTARLIVAKKIKKKKIYCGRNVHQMINQMAKAK